jgi:hypothetical protein
MAFAERDAFSAGFIHSLGLKVDSGCWSTIDLRSPRIDEFIARSSQLIHDGTATFYGINHLNLAWQEEGDTPVEWYQIVGRSRIDCNRSRHDIETVRADRMARDIHLAFGMFSNPYVSERFKDVVETNCLTGIEFVWLQDLGKYQAAQWYIPVAQYPMGRGVDHPWFDSRTLKGSDSWQPLSPRFRTGAWSFDSNQIRKNLKLAYPYPELFELYKAYPEGVLCHLGIRSYRTYVRRFLPTTDFAFVWTQEDQIEDPVRSYRTYVR